jgi:hypothetical protein
VQRDERVIGRHRSIERALHAAEPIVVRLQAVERELDREELEPRFLQHVFERRHRPVEHRPVGRHVDLADAVVADEGAADLGKFLADERLATRQVQVLDRPEALGQPADLVHRQVVLPVQVAPVEAVLARLVARRVDEEDQERRRPRPVARGEGTAHETEMAPYAAQGVHRRPQG